MKLHYDISGPNNTIDLVTLNIATNDAIRYAEHGNYEVVGIKVIQSTVSDGFIINFRMEVTLTEKEKS